MRIWSRGDKRVYVDAKILNMHDKMSPKEAYVGYVIEGGERRVKRVDAAESDDAEVLAILFAMEDLNKRFRRLTVVCDHESVVSEANRETVKGASPLMNRLRQALRENPSVELEALKSNPAHVVITEYVNSVKREAETPSERYDVEGK